MPRRNEVIMHIKTNNPAMIEHLILNALCRDRTPAEVLRQYLKCRYNRNDLNSPFSSYNDYEYPVAKLTPLPHPFATACENGNIPVVKLFLLLGAEPNAKILEHGKQSPLEAFKDKPEIQTLLTDDTPWLARRYSDELAAVMKRQIEKSILHNDILGFMFYGVQGLRITDSSIVFTREFCNSIELAQAFVYRMLMSSRQRKAIARKIEKKRGRQYIPPVLQRAIESESAENMDKLRKIVDSSELLPEDVEFEIINSVLSKEEQISLIRLCTEKSNLYRTNRKMWLICDKLLSDLYSYMMYIQVEAIKNIILNPQKK